MADYRDEVLHSAAWRLQEAMRDHCLATRSLTAALAERNAANTNVRLAEDRREMYDKAIKEALGAYREKVEEIVAYQADGPAEQGQHVASPEPDVKSDTRPPTFAVGSRVRVVRLLQESAPQMGSGRSATIGQEGYIGAFDLSTPGYPWWCSITVRRDGGTSYLTAFPYASRELELLPGWVERLPDDSVAYHTDEEPPSLTVGVVKLTWDQAEEVRAGAREATLAIEDFLRANDRILKGTSLALKMQEAHHRLSRVEEMIREAEMPR